MPLRSMYRTFGCMDTTTIDPGGSGLASETNGWSIQPPASWSRYGSLPIALWRLADVGGASVGTVTSS
jgi:hypothetical protein